MESSSPFRWLLLILAVALIAVGVHWFRTPEHSFKAAVSSVEKGDIRQFENYVDFPRLAADLNAHYTDLVARESPEPKSLILSPFGQLVSRTDLSMVIREMAGKKTIDGKPLTTAGPDLVHASLLSIDTIDRMKEGDADYAVVHTTFEYANGRPVKLAFRMRKMGSYWRVLTIENAEELIRNELIASREKDKRETEKAASAAADERKRKADEANARLQQLITEYNSTPQKPANVPPPTVTAPPPTDTAPAASYAPPMPAPIPKNDKH